ncbi:MAG: GNAT family N-acetyltransferase, partial [Leptospira sp.]|nr:GNAT family N-acetyltransferase [Leptospira sp.]
MAAKKTPKSKPKSKTDSRQKSTKHKLELRFLRSSDYQSVQNIMEQVFSKAFDGAWTKEEFERQIAIFPEGQIAIEDRGEVVAAAISMIVRYSDHGDRHTYHTITGGGGLPNHNPDGDTLYGVDVFVNPKYQGLRLGRRLYDARKELCE